MDDGEEQENELLALEAIYEEREFIRSKEELGGEIKIFLDVSQPFRIIFTDSKSSGTATNEGENSELEVNFLPPIVLNFSYPPDYPSVKLPNYTLSCKWLNRSQLGTLCKELEQQWSNNGPGLVILFEWVQFLTEETMSLLGIESPFVVENMMGSKYARRVSMVSSKFDDHAIQDVASIEELKDFLIEYDNYEQNRQFDTTLFSCNVCFIEKLGEKCCSFHPCKHVFCNECMSEYFKLQIQDGAVNSLTCPNDKCESEATPSQVKRLVHEEYYEKYEKFLLQSTLDCMTDIINCPRNMCQSPVLLENGTTIGMCAKCSFAFCTMCRRSYHGVSPCPIKQSEFADLRKKYARAGPEEKLRLEKRYGKRNLKYALEDAISEKWIEDNSKKCPSCKSIIQKISGCNKMTCYRCHGSFCWLCLTTVSKSNPYFHFNNLQSRCFNKLFEGAVDEEPDWFQVV